MLESSGYLDGNITAPHNKSGFYSYNHQAFNQSSTQSNWTRKGTNFGNINYGESHYSPKKTKALSTLQSGRPIMAPHELNRLPARAASVENDDHPICTTLAGLNIETPLS